MGLWELSALGDVCPVHWLPTLAAVLGGIPNPILSPAEGIVLELLVGDSQTVVVEGSTTAG